MCLCIIDIGELLEAELMVIINFRFVLKSLVVIGTWRNVTSESSTHAVKIMLKMQVVRIPFRLSDADYHDLKRSCLAYSRKDFSFCKLAVTE